MLRTAAGLGDHLSAVVRLMERYGVEIDPRDQPLGLALEADGSLRFRVAGGLPGGPAPDARTTIDVRERWRPEGDGAYRRTDYAYELLDRERDLRRAFHCHDQGYFEREFLVVVHEHCERPIGVAPCDHLRGDPIRDGFAAVEVLMSAWVDDVPDCGSLPCLE